MARKNRPAFSNLQKRVFDLVKKIPRGKVTTYKIIAQKLGNPGLARAIGNTLNKNRDLKAIPCYRVVKSNGEIGGYRAGKIQKTNLLKKDRIKIKDGRIRDLNFYLWTKT